MSKKKFYVVWIGHHPGIYDNWEVCNKEISGFKGAKYKSFPDRLSAEIAFRNGPDAYWGKDVVPVTDLTMATEQPVSPAIAVDAACAGNPGKMEYRGVFVDFSLQTRKELFKSPVFENGTNNIGEFLAIVHALAWQKQKSTQYPIYSDSYNAQLWVKQKKCKTKLQPNDKNAYLFELIERAEKWLLENDDWMRENISVIPVLKWKTEIWGEIPADYGRK